MSGLFNSPKMPDPVPVPVIPEPTVMPMPDDKAMRKAKRDSLLKQQQRSGRASTILSSEDKLG